MAENCESSSVSRSPLRQVWKNNVISQFHGEASVQDKYRLTSPCAMHAPDRCSLLLLQWLRHVLGPSARPPAGRPNRQCQLVQGCSTM